MYIYVHTGIYLLCRGRILDNFLAKNYSVFYCAFDKYNSLTLQTTFTSKPSQLQLLSFCTHFAMLECIDVVVHVQFGPSVAGPEGGGGVHDLRHGGQSGCCGAALHLLHLP